MREIVSIRAKNKDRVVATPRDLEVKIGDNIISPNVISAIDIRVRPDEIISAQVELLVGELDIDADLNLSVKDKEPTIEERALAWALSGDTGISSETMCAYFTGVEKGGPFGSQAPSDAADRGRCIRLLKLIPEWIERLDELKALDVGTISINGAEPIPRRQDSHSWTHQVPLIIKEGGF